MPTATGCPPIVVSRHPMLVKLEQLADDDELRRSVIEGISEGGDAANRLSRIERDGLMDGYPGQDAKHLARRQLLDGLWGNEASLGKISAALKQAFELVESQNKRLVARWIPGLTGQEIVSIVTVGAEAVYLILLTRALGANAVMDKAAYDPELLAHLRGQAHEVVTFFDLL